MKTVDVVFRPDGTVQYETKGFAGESCKEASKFVHAALSGKVVKDEPTAEASIRAGVRQSAKTR